MNINRFKKIQSLFLSSALLAQFTIPATYASDPPQVYGTSHKLASAPSGRTGYRRRSKKAKKRREPDSVEREKAARVEDKSTSKAQKSEDEPNPYPGEQKRLPKKEAVNPLPPIPTFPNIEHAYPSSPPCFFTHMPQESGTPCATDEPTANPGNSGSTNQRDEIPSSGAKFNILPDFSSYELSDSSSDSISGTPTDSAQKNQTSTSAIGKCFKMVSDLVSAIMPSTNPSLPPVPAPTDTDPTAKRQTRRDTPKRCDEEGRKQASDVKTVSTEEKLLNILFVPEARRFCHGLPAPILVIGINKRFEGSLADTEFEEKAKKEIIDWVRSHTILEGEDITTCLTNVEMIFTTNKIFKLFREILGLRGWVTTCCNGQCKCQDLVMSHRSNRLEQSRSGRNNDYDWSSLCAVIRYFNEFPELINLDAIRYHPIFSDKEITDTIDELSILLEGFSYDDDIFECLLKKPFLRKITNDTYSNPILATMQSLFRKAALNYDLNCLLNAIGYFNLVRTVQILPLK